jgi:hypothetical protein
MISSHLGNSADSLALEIVAAGGEIVRRYEKGVNPNPDPRANGHWPDWWIAPWPELKAGPGLHRFAWDLRYARPAVTNFSFPISAIPGRTVPEPLGPFVTPGTYTVRLLVDRDTLTQPVRVRMDPRVRTPTALLASRDSLHLAVYRAVNDIADARKRVTDLRSSIREQQATVRGPRADSLSNFDRQLASLEGAATGRDGRGATSGPPGVNRFASLPQLQNELMTLYNVIEDSDNAPTTAVTSAARQRLAQSRTTLAAVRRLGIVIERR